MNNRPSSERGQALVLMVLAMVVLLGFTALAVDGSMIYSDRRFTQSAADASSLAGGGATAQKMTALGVSSNNFIPTGINCSAATTFACSANAGTAASVGRSAAVSRAADNTFTILNNDISTDQGVVTACGCEPVLANKVGGGTYLLYTDKYIDVKSRLNKTTLTAFAHFVFSDPLRNVVESVTRVHPMQPAAFGNAIVALNPADCQGNANGQQFHGLGGSGNITVTGGGLFSNGCMDTDGNVHVTVNNGSAAYFYTANHSTLGNISFTGGGSLGHLDPNVSSNRIPQNAYDVAVPAACLNGSNRYTEAQLKAAQPLNGLYCVAPGGLSLSGHDSLVGTDVTLVFMGGKVTINGGGTVDLKGPTNTYTGSALPGVVIFMPREYYDCADASDNSNTLQINGNSGNIFQGTILAPCSTVNLNGSSSNYAFNTQVIGYDVNVGGSSGTQVIYQEDRNLLRPAYMDLYR